jgi:hypothetical protein
MFVASTAYTFLAPAFAALQKQHSRGIYRSARRRAKSPYRQDSTACADVEHDLAFETVSVIHYGMVVSVHPPHVAQHLLLHRAQARGTRHNITNGTISQESTGRALLV